jgi:hypothetical protein
LGFFRHASQTAEETLKAPRDLISLGSYKGTHSLATRTLMTLRDLIAFGSYQGTPSQLAEKREICSAGILPAV